MKKVAKNEIGGSNRPSKKYKINYIKIMFILCIVYCSVIFAKQQLQINEYNVKIEDTNEQIESKKDDTEKLKEFKNKTSDPEYIEKIAREKLGLVKPYEKVFIDVNK